MIIKLLAIIVLGFSLFSCNEPTQELKAKNDLQYDKVLVSYNVAAEEWPDKYKKEGYTWQNCIPFLLPESEMDMKAFLKKYITRALEKNVEVYDESLTYDPYRPLNKDALFNVRDKWVSFTYGVEEELDTVDLLSNMKFINFERYTSLMFFEEWYFNVQDLDFWKTVLGVSPVYRFLRFDDLFRGRSGLIVPALYMDKKAFKASDSRMEKLGKLVYEYRLNRTSCENSELDEFDQELVNDYAPMINKHVYLPIIEKLLYAAINGDLPVCDFYEENKQLSTDEVAEKCNFVEEEMTMVDEDGNEIIRTLAPYLDIYNFHSLVFEEELYIDWETLRLTKKVLSITPVNNYIHPEMGHPVKKLTFKIKMK